MTDTLWQTLEEKMMILISENERLRKENTTLKFEREQHSKRLYDLVALIDSAPIMDSAAPVMTNINVSAVTPLVIQGEAS